MQKKFFTLVSCATAAFVLLAVSVAQAQSVPSTAEPSRVKNQITPMQSPSLVEGTTSLTSGPAVSAPAGSDKIKFTLKSVEMDGMTAYQTSEVASLYEDMVGQTISLADVYALAERMTSKYRNEGYVLTQIVVPPQTIDSGNVRLRVVEGFVDNVSIQGATRSNIAYLAPFADKIRAAKPLNTKALERYLLLMNDLSGISSRAVLSPSKTPGASDVTLVVDQKPYDLFFQVDNRGSRYLGPLQVNAGARLNNMFGFYEGLNLQAVTTPTAPLNDRELDYFNVSWTQPINHEGTKLTFGGGITGTEPGFELEPFDVEGLAHNLNFEISHPFIRSRVQNFYTALKLNYLNSERSDNLGGPKIEDRLRVLRLSNTYQLTDRFVGVNSLNLEVSKGLDIFSMKEKGSANMTRADGDPEFFKGTFEASRLQRINDRFDFLLAASGQLSAQNLLASEEFGVGGASFGSAYDSSEITGEQGLAGRVELRMNTDVRAPVNQFQVYSFYDIGKVWDNDNASAKDRQRALSSSGGGFRTTINDTISSSFELAFPLTREVDTQNDKNPRLFGSLTVRY